MVWPFNKSQPGSTPVISNSSDVLDSVDPSLQQFYTEALPIKPLSLAPQALKDRVASEQHAKQASLKSATVAFADSEHNAQRRRVTDSGGALIQTLFEAATENCALLGARYGECQRHGSMWSVMLSCHKEAENHHTCIGLQRKGLASMGYNQAVDSVQKREMKYTMDDLYTKHFPDGVVTEQTKKAFLAEVDQERVRISKDLYRV